MITLYAQSIISIFLGEQLQELFENIGNASFLETADINETIDIGVRIPKIAKDLSDRNRTSPFAFTGNKFEFRMPGSSASASTPVFMINTIVADILKEYADILEKTSASFCFCFSRPSHFLLKYFFERVVRRVFPLPNSNLFLFSFSFFYFSGNKLDL